MEKSAAGSATLKRSLWDLHLVDKNVKKHRQRKEKLEQNIMDGLFYILDVMLAENVLQAFQGLYEGGNLTYTY